ncbi:hypothetical protein G6W61_26590 [Streptomyces sp. KAI-26]|uniref:hypothetical protein n=1 Tax=Streptomyces sp. KAI-26 TaxID=1169747 RepID=UPI001587272D|nr:hypothetical protein [Streptomyces sp. KAI-26]NUV89736.1 hypothetical protein [Streptomyces sp. KAI-26]NUW20053.1 hypothetical protein [Streptomyces roseoviolaceus]
MTTQQGTALTHALAEVPGPLPTSGVIHVATPHTSRFTIVGNHLAQHAELSLTAIGLGTHIQSLPTGSRIGIKSLAARFPEGETRIAAALRELEAHGYLHRTRVRLANGRITTRTVFRNQPGPTGAPHPEPPTPAPAPAPAAAPAPAPAPAPVPAPAPAPAPVPAPAPKPGPALTPPATRGSMPVPAPEPAPVPQTRPPAPAPSCPVRRGPARLLPQPRELTPELRQTASTLLADLRRHAPELVLSEADIERLTPATATWLERDARPETIRQALTTELPQPVKYPAKFVRHRLTALLPPPLPGTEELTPARTTLVIPMQNCEGCERGYRSRVPGHCRGCQAQLSAA